MQDAHAVLPTYRGLKLLLAVRNDAHDAAQDDHQREHPGRRVEHGGRCTSRTQQARQLFAADLEAHALGRARHKRHTDC